MRFSSKKWTGQNPDHVAILVGLFDFVSRENIGQRRFGDLGVTPSVAPGWKISHPPIPLPRKCAEKTIPRVSHDPGLSEEYNRVPVRRGMKIIGCIISKTLNFTDDFQRVRYCACAGRSRDIH